MKLPIRYFSIGLITASIIMLVVISFFNNPVTNKNDFTVDEMILSIKEEGYHVLSASEYITLTVKDTQIDDDVTASKEQEQDAEIEETEPADEDETQDETETEIEVVEYTYTLNVEPNMLGPTISNLLVENNILDNADDFNRYLELEGYAPYIQLGEHKLSSKMDNHQIAETIAKKR